MSTKKIYTLDDLKVCAGPCGRTLKPKKMPDARVAELLPGVKVFAKHTVDKCVPCSKIRSPEEEAASVERNRANVEAWLASRSRARQRVHAARPARWRISA